MLTIWQRCVPLPSGPQSLRSSIQPLFPTTVSFLVVTIVKTTGLEIQGQRGEWGRTPTPESQEGLVSLQVSGTEVTWIWLRKSASITG